MANGEGYNFLTGQIGETPEGTPIFSGISGASGLGGVVGGFMDLIGSKKRGQQQANLAQKAGRQILDFYKDVERGRFDTKLDPGFTDVYEMSRRKTPTDALDRAAAMGLSNISGMGTRGQLAALNPFMQNVSSMETQLSQSDLAREMQGAQAYATQRQGVSDANLGFRRGLATRKLEQDELAQRTAMENMERIKQERRDALGNIAMGGLETGLAAAASGMFKREQGGIIPKYKKGGEFPDFNKDGEITQADVLMGRGVIPKAEYGMKVPENKNYNMGGMMKKYQMGGNVLAQILGGAGGDMPKVQGPLPGEASHETNPMDIVDKNGVKRGEAMGGEFIVNAEQAEGMMSEYEPIKSTIESGKQPTQEQWMAFYEAIDAVLGEPQFDDSEGGPQMMG